MTTTEGWTAAVRDRLAPGRLLPLGTAEDGAWITERAVRQALDRTATAVRGVVPGRLRVGLDPDGEQGPEPLPVPPGGLPPGPLRITAAVEVPAAAGGRLGDVRGGARVLGPDGQALHEP
ncbi:hypothetical protein ACWDNT_34140, partial [Streptomyces sp. NPDC000963]